VDWITWRQVHSYRWTVIHATRDFNEAICGAKVGPYGYLRANDSFKDVPRCPRCKRLAEAREQAHAALADARRQDKGESLGDPWK